MPVDVSLIVVASRSARDLVRCADSAARRSSPGTEILFALGADAPLPVVRSLERRLNVTAFSRPAAADAVRAAVGAARGDLVAVVPAAVRLRAGMVERCAAAARQDGPCAVVPALRVAAPDGTPISHTRFEPVLAKALGDPRGAPPVVVQRRGDWLGLGGLDPSFGRLAAWEWWLRLLASGHPVRTLEDELVLFEAAGDAWWPPVPAGEEDLDAYRRVLAKHRSLVEREMPAILIEREVSFARLLDRHRDLVRRRDADLAELDRLRAATAHHRAYLSHHGRDALEWGDLRRTDPVSRDWGYDRGDPVDRHHIETFLAAHSSDIRGAVLEVQEDDFTRRFGAGRVARADVVDLDEANPRATIVADLRAAPDLTGSSFDCIVLTQTLHVIDDVPAVLRECFRLLRPGGVLLATLPCASRVCREYGEEGDLWRVTPAGARALVEPVFGAANVETTAYGNVLTNVAFLHGLARQEITDAEFDRSDGYYPALVGVRARKPHAERRGRTLHHRAAVLLYHRIDEAEDVHRLNVPRALFEQQLAWLSRECHVLPLAELLEGIRDGLPERAVAITFDDGYLDTLDVAAPLLERFEMPATVFATSRWLGGPGEYWWDALERALLAGDRPSVLTVAADGRRTTLPTATMAERHAAHARLHEMLVHARFEVREAIVADVAAWAGGGTPRYRPLVADELRALAARPGIAIGAHSVTHVALPDQPVDVQAREVRESAAVLGDVAGKRIDLFAYPYGAVDRASADLVRQACRWGVSCDAAPVGGSFDAARVPRVEVSARPAQDILPALVS